MDPTIKSLLTSFAAIAAGGIAAWAAKSNLIPSADQATVTNDLVMLVGGAAAAALAWYKSRTHTPTAQIAAVNEADNGVKVVPAASPTPCVTAPLK